MNKQFSSFFCGPLPNQVLKNVFHAENDFAKINVLQATFFSIVSPHSLFTASEVIWSDKMKEHVQAVVGEISKYSSQIL